MAVSQTEKLLLLRISSYYLSDLFQPQQSNLHVIQEGKEAKNAENRRASEVN